MTSSTTLSGRVVVLSTHLDDAVFSLGAFMAHAARRGSEIRMLTVLAGDPASDEPAGRWDTLSGFRTAGEAARMRREEDLEAARVLGVRAEWLPFPDEQYPRHDDDDAIWRAIEGAVEDADAVLAPGYPLAHADHAWLARLVLTRRLPDLRVGAYVEQPYEHNRRRRGPPRLPAYAPPAEPWSRLPADERDRRAKRRAYAAYRSQLAGLSRKPLLAWRVTLRERYLGGEAVAWLSSTNHRS